MSLVTALEAPASISNAIKKASRATGVDFSYLLKTAARESSFNKSAKAKTSSAAGLFQFIESTWLKTVKDAGDKFGLGKYTPHIHKTQSGRYYVPNRKLRNEILQLRHNPEISAMMAGAFTQQNSDFVASRVGRKPSAGELYIAHFLGPKGAAKLISLAEDSPNARADRHFPAAARANKPIFYSRGRPRTVAQVYKNLVRHHQKLEATTPPSITAQKAPQSPEPTPAVAPLATHFKKATAGEGIAKSRAVQPVETASSPPTLGSPARQVIPSEQDLQALTHKVKIAPAPVPARIQTPSAHAGALGAGVETQVLEQGRAEKAFGLAGHKAAPIGRAARVDALTGNSVNLANKTKTDTAKGSIGSWTTIVQLPSSAPGLVPSAADSNVARTPQPKAEPVEPPRRRPRAPSLLEQSAQRAASRARRLSERAQEFRPESFWERMSLFSG